MNLVFAAVVAVCVALAPCLAQAQPSAQADANISRKFLTPIEHVVVLMLENRSFDHYLGLLKGKRPAVDGCLPDMAQCSNPRDPLDASSPSYPVTNRGINVQASPSHSVHGTTTQIFGASDPQTNGDTSDHEAFSLGAEDMRGFVRSYASVVGEAAAASVMDCLDPSHVPVLATLAEEFLLFDSWFASVPGPTEPNRCYAIAASSHGMSTNDVETMVRGLPNKTLFRQLTELQLDWRVYFELLPTTLMFKDMRHADARRRYFRMDRFFEDVAAGDLPFYTWIEPNYYPTERRPADDQHPDHSVADGERLIKDVYEALRANEQLWGKTALLVTYDEHGGFFDHVAPPNPVPSPDGLVNTAADPFDFQRLGVRVPTVVASPWVRRGHVESLRPDGSGGAYEHSSLAATLAHHMVGPRLAQNQTAPHAVPFLSARDAWARPFAHVFQTLSAPRDGTPAVLPEPFYGAKGRTRYTPQKLNDLQQDLLLIVAGVANDGAFNETAVRSEWTDAQAVEYIRRQLGAYFPNAPLDA